MSNLTHFEPAIEKRVQSWLDGDYDTATKKALETMISDHPKDLIDAFYCDLSFGTGGLRGLMGVGTNRLNIYTIRLATQGLANYILKTPHDHPQLSVAIGYDSRHHSKEFAEETARVFAGNGITAHLFPELRPTPYTSFACRELKCQAAVMITASHNPKEYNGYKVYWSDGAQIVSPHDLGIISEVNKISSQKEVKLAPPDSPLIKKTDTSLDQKYLDAIFLLQKAKERNHSQGKNLKIAYTSLHGTGITLAPKALESWGFTTIAYEKQQIIPDGDFPTVSFPNPEYPETLKLGIELLTKEHCDILLANDPDADRLGVVVLHQNKPVILTGNEVAAICVDYLCKTIKKITPYSAFVTTIVSTPLISKIARTSGATSFEVLTGFKYIGEKIREWENGAYQFIFGAEESYGYLLGTIARDKDAIVSSCLIAEIALAAKLEGKTLIDKLHDIYRTHGIYREGQRSISFKPGKEGADAISQMIHNLQQNPPTTLCGKKVLALEDYQKQKRFDFTTHKETPLTLPVSDVLVFWLENDTRLIIRPSGTEPKVKLYGSICLQTTSSVNETIATADAALNALLASAEADLRTS